MTSKSIKLASSFGFAGLIALVLFGVLICLNDLMAWTSTALGLAVGWAAGILAAPYESEQRPFEKIGGVVAAFITGFALSKVDSIFALWIDPARGPMILESALAYRVLLFATSFILAAVVTYVGRKYVSVGPDAETPKPEPGDRSSS